jgi:hypothetical protein
MDEILKKIDEEIVMYQQRIKNRQGQCYHDERERLLRFEERLHEAERIKEIIISSQPEPCDFCSKVDFVNDYGSTFYKSLIDSDSTEECVYIIKSEDGTYELVMNTETVKSKEINYCPICGRKLTN